MHAKISWIYFLSQKKSIAVKWLFREGRVPKQIKISLICPDALGYAMALDAG